MSIRIVKIKGARGNTFRLTQRLGRDEAGKWIEKSRTFPSLRDAETEKARLQLEATLQAYEAATASDKAATPRRPRTAAPAPAKFGAGTRVLDYFVALLDAAEVQKTVSPGTVAQSRSFIRNHLVELLGDATLETFTRADAKAFILQLAKRGLSPASQRTLKNRLSSAFSVALEDELIQGNPFMNLAVAGVRKSAGQVMTEDELQRFQKVCTTHRFGLLMRFLLATGLRRGEVSALVWRDVDLTKGIVHVTKQRAQVNGRVYESKPKSARSVRKVGIPPTILTMLRARFAADADLAQQAGASVSMMPVFCHSKGGHIAPNEITKHVKAALTEAGLGHLRTHDLRHAHATMLLQTVPIGAVSRRLGHSSPQITLGVYEHALPTDDEKATTAADDFA